MSVKTLKIGSRPQGSVSSLLYDPYTDPGSKLYRPPRNFPSLSTSSPSSSKSDDGIIGSVVSMVTSQAQNISAADVASLAAQLKVPVLIIIGIAAAAAIIYLVYKVYTNREPIGRAINEFINDLKSVAPDLTGVPGWIDSIRNEVADAFSAKNPATAVEKLANIKAAILNHQKTINPANIGHGFNFFANYPYPPLYDHTGTGLKVPLN